jgi:hypothetical protein
MFKKKTTATVLSAFSATINALLAVQADHAEVAEKKADEAHKALREANVAREEAARAGAVAAKFQKLVDSESN